MFYSNVKKSLDLPSSPFGFIKNFIKGDKERCRQNGTSGESLDFSRGSPGRLSLPRKNLGLEGLRKKYRSEPALPFSDDNQSVITAATLPEILMASIQRQHVQLNNSEPAATPPESTYPRRSQSTGENPPSPRQGKRKKLSHESSSPSLTTKQQRKQSQGSKHRHSLIIEPPKICNAWDAQSDQTRSDTSSLRSELSMDSFVELDDKTLTKIQYIVNELITTEKVYMQDLQDILAGYMVPMEQCTDLFTPETVRDIFVNIQPIGDFHLNFLEQLDEHKSELDSLANCFLTKESEAGFALYNEFCRKVPQSLSLISSLQKEPQTLQFIVDCKQELKHFFPLSEFLHRPIQRILKYPLLLRDLQKYTAGTKYAAAVEGALDKITGVAIHINNVKRVQELESHEILGWPGEPLLEFGVLKLEDSFKVNGSDGRYIFLFEKLLLITKHKDGKYQYKAHLLPTEIGITEGEQSNPKFEIEKFHQKKKFAVQAPSVETKATWVYEIKRCLLEHLPNISPENREVLLNGIPSMDKTNQFNDILSNSKYKSFIYLPSYQHEPENGPITPDIDTQDNNATSPIYQSPSPAFVYNCPSPDRLEDSGIEDPGPKNQVDYSSLDVKAIKDRWKRQERKAGNNTAPVRLFHHRNTPASPRGLWSVDEREPSPSEYVHTKATALAETKIKDDEMSEEHSKPCLARIAHIQEKQEEGAPIVRGLQDLINADAANSQATYAPDPEPGSNSPTTLPLSNGTDCDEMVAKFAKSCTVIDAAQSSSCNIENDVDANAERSDSDTISEHVSKAGPMKSRVARMQEKVEGGEELICPVKKASSPIKKLEKPAWEQEILKPKRNQKRLSLVRGVLDCEVTDVVNADKEVAAQSPRTLNKNRLRRRAGQRGGKEDTSESEEDRSPHPPRSTPSMPSTTSKNDSLDKVKRAVSSIPLSAQSTGNKVSGFRERTPSFEQAENPFSKVCAIPQPTSTFKSRHYEKDRQPTCSRERQPLTAASSKSLPSNDFPKSEPRRSRPVSEGRSASDLKEAYLNAAKFSGSSTSSSKKPEGDPSLQELNTVRSSQLVARMRIQLLENNK